MTLSDLLECGNWAATRGPRQLAEVAEDMLPFLDVDAEEEARGIIALCACDDLEHASERWGRLAAHLRRVPPRYARAG